MNSKHITLVRSAEEEIERLIQETEDALHRLENTAMELDTMTRIIRVLRNALDSTPVVPVLRSIGPSEGSTPQST